MLTTALHRILGLGPGPLTIEMVDEAVLQQLPEGDELEFKSELPPAKGAATTDFPKDLAAMANANGGVIIYGVAETDKRASARIDTGELTETHERSLRSVAMTAVTPPLYGLSVHRLGESSAGGAAVALVVPPSADGPHLIYRNDYFGAPLRVDADTKWMREAEVARMYRARFDEQRRHFDALDALYDETCSRRPRQDRAWFVGAAVPRHKKVGPPPAREVAAKMFERAQSKSSAYLLDGSPHFGPLGEVEWSNPRPGLRRWTAVPTRPGAVTEAWANFHHDGSVSLTYSMGGQRMSADTSFDDEQFFSETLESGVADFMAMLRIADESAEYDISIGVEWDSARPLLIWTKDDSNYPFSDKSIPLSTYVRVESTVVTAAATEDFQRQVYDIAQDCINQGGLTIVRSIREPSA